jgi:outer membrane lipoprotein-sorting protein
MRKGKKLISLMISGVLFLAGVSGQSYTGREIIEKANNKIQGEETGYSEMTMTIIRPGWERKVSFKSWTKGRDYALTLITAPAREKGQSFLKRGNEMWNWNPTINRLIKLPPAMMSQGWMGSDYTNDDILRESSIVVDYEHEILGEEEVDGRMCYKVKMLARPDAVVIWGHQIRWIDKEEFLFLRAELYDEDGYLVRRELGTDLKIMDGRLIPTRMEINPVDEEGHKTLLVIDKIEFNNPIRDSFFSQQRMKTIR